MLSTKTRVLTAHVPFTLAEKIDQFSQRMERSRGWIIKQALASWIEQEERRSALTWEALSDVDHNKTIDHQTMQEWAQSLGTEQSRSTPF